MLARLKQWYHRMMMNRLRGKSGTGDYYKYHYHEKKAR